MINRGHIKRFSKREPLSPASCLGSPWMGLGFLVLSAALHWNEGTKQCT